jgi:hypothetical protein
MGTEDVIRALGQEPGTAPIGPSVPGPALGDGERQHRLAERPATVALRVPGQAKMIIDRHGRGSFLGVPALPCRRPFPP